MSLTTMQARGDNVGKSSTSRPPVFGDSVMKTSTQTQGKLGRKYKSRKERPCDACRKRKICCTRDAQEKDCSLCRTRGETCKYIAPPNVRRSRQGGAVTAPNVKVNNPPSTSPSSSTSGPQLPAQCEDGPRSKQVTERGEWICQFAGFSGDQDPYVLRHCSFNDWNYYKAPDWAVLRMMGANSDIPLHFTVVPPDSHLDERPSFYPNTDTELVVAPHQQKLLGTYFNVIHTSYPLLDPLLFSSEVQKDKLLHAVLYNLAAPFSLETPTHFQALTDYIQQALPIKCRQPRLQILEASLLYLHRHPTTHHPPSLLGLWPDIGSLVGIAHDLGLNLNPTSWNLSAADRNRRLRVWWALYMAEKWSAFTLGRPSYLNPDNCNVPMISISAFSHRGLNGEDIGLMPALQFIAMATLTTILADVLSSCFTLKAIEKMRLLPAGTIFSLMNDFRHRLQAWRVEHLLPLCNVNSLLDNSGNVVLAFYTVESALYRAILRNLDMAHPGYSVVRTYAKNTLMSVVGFLEKLSANRTIAFWWSPMMPHCLSLHGTFMFQHLLTSFTTSDIELWSSTISHYRSLLNRLQVQDHSFNLTRLACLRLDMLSKGLGLHLPGLGDDLMMNGGIGGEAGFGKGEEERNQIEDGEVGEKDGARTFEELFGLRSGSGSVPAIAQEWIAKQGQQGAMLG